VNVMAKRRCLWYSGVGRRCYALINAPRVRIVLLEGVGGTVSGVTGSREDELSSVPCTFGESAQGSFADLVPERNRDAIGIS
jgi:hypothetical protein